MWSSWAFWYCPFWGYQVFLSSGKYERTVESLLQTWPNLYIFEQIDPFRNIKMTIKLQGKAFLMDDIRESRPIYNN